MRNFWKTLPPTFTILAPMEDVTDYTFRRVVAETASPDVFFTEFVSAELMTSRKPQKALSRFERGEAPLGKPLVAQIWGLSPEAFFKAGQIVASLGFDGIDINMGCPAKKISRRGACSGLIGNPKLAGELIQAAREGSGLPLSVKTRVGLKKKVTEEWCGFLLSQNLDALTVHGRVAAQMSEGFADWHEIQKVVSLRDQMGLQTLIVGNGDVFSREILAERKSLPGLNGVMVGRGIFHDPCIFGSESVATFEQWSSEDKLKLLGKHVNYFQAAWEGRKPFDLLKRFFKIYTTNFPGCLELRERLMSCGNFSEVKEILTFQSVWV